MTMFNLKSRLLQVHIDILFILSCMIFILPYAVDGQSLGKCPKKESMKGFNSKEASTKIRNRYISFVQ